MYVDLQAHIHSNVEQVNQKRRLIFPQNIMGWEAVEVGLTQDIVVLVQDMVVLVQDTVGRVQELVKVYQGGKDMAVDLVQDPVEMD